MLEIITITKNDITGLKRTVDSTKGIREKYNVRQLIIDSSDSDIKKLVSDFVLKEKNIVYFWQEPKGISAAFNYGLKEAQGEWIWCLNGGDAIKDGLSVEWFLNYLSMSKADTVIFQTVDMATGAVLEKTPPMWGIWPPLLSWIAHPSILIKKKVFNEFGFFDERYKLAMDYELYLRFFSKNISVDLV
ncbi:MAG: glycosyltransferase, partial [Candidatus Humimicrobiaceae bacterium]